MSRKNKNHAEFTGHLAADPKINNLPSGAPVANFVIITNEGWTNKDGIEQYESHDIVAFNGVVKKVVEPYFKKGTHLRIEGRLKTRKWTDKDGVDRYTKQVHMEEFEFLGKKSDSEAKAPDAPSSPTVEETAREYLEASHGI